jgi:hypothetical protein
MKQRLIELCNGSSFRLFVEKLGANLCENYSEVHQDFKAAKESQKIDYLSISLMKKRFSQFCEVGGQIIIHQSI